jgi:hypothetical protein
MVQGLHLRVWTPRPTALMTVAALSVVRRAVRQIQPSAARPSGRSLQSTCLAKPAVGRFSISKAGRSWVLRPVQLLGVLHTCAARYVLIIISLPDQTRSSQLDRLSKRRMSTYSSDRGIANRKGGWLACASPNIGQILDQACEDYEKECS